MTQQADKGTLDPLLKVATDFADLSNRTADSFDRLTDTVVKDLSPHISALTDVMGDLVQRLGGLSTGQLLGGLAAGYLGLQGTKAIGKAALRRALGRGAGGAATRLLPRLLPAGGAGAAGAGSAAAVPAAALAIPAALAVGGGIAGDKINRDTIRLMEQAQRQDADNRLAVVARANRDNAKNRREMLIAKRQQLAFMASQTAGSNLLRQS